MRNGINVLERLRRDWTVRLKPVADVAKICTVGPFPYVFRENAVNKTVNAITSRPDSGRSRVVATQSSRHVEIRGNLNLNYDIDETRGSPGNKTCVTRNETLANSEKLFFCYSTSSVRRNAFFPPGRTSTEKKS